MQKIESALLLQNVTSLAEGFSQLGNRLSQAASALQTTGQPPAKTLVDELAASRSAFAELCTQGAALAESLAVSPVPNPEAIGSLGELKALIQTLAQAEEKRNASKEVSRHALATLDRLYAIKHREREVFAPLSECQMRATLLRNAIAATPWPNVHPSAEELGRDDNPFVVLLTLVEKGNELEDEVCTKLCDIVERAFNRSLAIAALRGKLAFVSDDDELVEEQTRIVAAPPLASEPVGANTYDQPRIDPPSANGTASAAPAVILEPQITPLLAMPQATPDQVIEQPPVPTPVNLLSQVALENPSVHAAGTQNEAAEIHTEAAPVRGLAQIEPAPGDEATVITMPAAPTVIEEPVVMAVAVAPPLPEPKHEPLLAPPPLSEILASEHQVEEVGIVSTRYRFDAEDKAQKIASMILTRSPAVVEERPLFLRDLIWRLIFEEKPTLAFHTARCLELQYPDFHPRLPSWLMRTLVLSQRIRNPHGDMARLLKDDLSRCEADCRAIGEEDWDLAVEFLLLASSFVPALLAPETRASTILHGVCLGEGLENLAAYSNVIATYGDLSIPLEPTLFKKAGRAQTKESVGFVRRLIGSQENGTRKDVVAEHIEPLRAAVLGRQQAVIDELDQFKESTLSIPLLGSIAACRRAVEHVGALLDAEAPFSADEPLPRPLLNAELSRMPSLVLNKQGEVEGIEHPTFVDNLLRFTAAAR